MKKEQTRSKLVRQAVYHQMTSVGKGGGKDRKMFWKWGTANTREQKKTQPAPPLTAQQYIRKVELGDLGFKINWASLSFCRYKRRVIMMIGA